MPDTKYSRYFGWDTERQCTVYLDTLEPVGCTPIDDALAAAESRESDDSDDPQST